MKPIIDYENLFIETLKNGINLFTGAGFSKLPDKDGNILPDATALSSEICKMFNISESFSCDLERVSNIASTRSKDLFQSFLREKYTVSSYNPLYDTLNKITIKSYITTNIDNTIQCVIDNSSRYFLNDITRYGASKKNKDIITYIPLHGEVKNESNLYFGKFELANVDVDNRALFDTMHAKLLEAPTLFMGYGFHDNAVERIISKVIQEKRHNIWVQCYNNHSNANYFRELGCYVIEADTESLLTWIDEKLDNYVLPPSNVFQPPIEYQIPTINQVEVVSAENYFSLGQTHWYCILANYAYETKYVNLAYEKYLTTKNLLCIGIPFSGKTTMLMQLASKIIVDNKVVMNSITYEQAKLFVNRYHDTDITIFIDNCCDDIDAIALLMEQNKFKVIGFADDYAFESSKHKLVGFNFECVNIHELKLEEAQRIYNKIPKAIKKRTFSYNNNDNQQYSMLEFVADNVYKVLSIQKVKIILERIKEQSQIGFEIVALTTYLSVNRSLLNTDVLFSYFNTSNYEYIQNEVRKVKSYLWEYDLEFSSDMSDQDYYSLRSNMFLYYSSAALMKFYNREYSAVIQKFIENVPPHVIYKNHIFKRKAYDARMMKQLFGENANNLYQRLFNTDSSAYNLQQWALYKALNGNYSEAFRDIDKAINMQRNNFSIKNTRAIILFEANKDKKTDIALSGLIEAMEILESCFNNDKRKIFHAIKYAEFAIYLKNFWNNFQYIDQAKQWLEIANNEANGSNKHIIFLLNQI
ncbi:MAG: SIR2 family protein [Clostridia bacterium]|nr:SIR2 family protein [Clostridia bacterium]